MTTEANTRFFNLVETLSKLSADQQNAFFEKLKETFTAEEIKALQIGVSYLDCLMHPEKGNAIKVALAEQLYKQFNA